MTERKFYKHVFTFEVLSEEPLESYDFEDIVRDTIDGHLIGHVGSYKLNKELNGKETAEELYEFNSDPGFFMLDDDGDDSDDSDT